MRNTKTRTALTLCVGALLAAGVACAAPPGAIYAVPSPLPAGSNGDIIKQSTFSYKNDSRIKATFIQYRSTNAMGQPMAVSGTVLIPTTAYTGTRPIVGIGPFTLGIADKCAVSKIISGGDSTVDEALKRGWAVALTDYEGLGTTDKPHTYMVGQSQGRALLDSVRAAIKLPGSGLSAAAPIGIAGYSQGGASAGWAGELQPTYAPELNVKGVAAGGTPANLIRVGENLTGTFSFGLALGASFGFDVAYPELDLETYLNAAGRDAFAKADTQCVVDLVIAHANKRIEDYTVTSPLDDPKWVARLNENKLGGGKPSVPTMLWHGVTDTTIPIDQAETLRASYCAQGVAVQWLTANTDHVGGLGPYNTAYGSYLAARFAGTPATSNC